MQYSICGPGRRSSAFASKRTGPGGGKIPPQEQSAGNSESHRSMRTPEFEAQTLETVNLNPSGCQGTETIRIRRESKPGQSGSRMPAEYKECVFLAWWFIAWIEKPRIDLDHTLPLNFCGPRFARRRAACKAGPKARGSPGWGEASARLDRASSAFGQQCLHIEER